MLWRRPQPIRVRLTLWYVLLLAGVLALYLGVVAPLLFWQMRSVVRRLGIEDIETVEGLLYFQPSGALDVQEDYHTHTQWRQVEQRYLEVLGPNEAEPKRGARPSAGLGPAPGMTALYRNDRLRGRSLGGPPFPDEGENGYSVRAARMSDGTRILLFSRRHVLDGRALLIRLAYPLSLVWGQWWEALSILLLVLPLPLAATAYAGYKMAGWAFDPIAAITQRAAQINSERLHERLPVGNPADELGQLSAVINAMLARIEQGFEQLRRFTADASHELRTPLAALRSLGEVRLSGAADAAAYRDTLGSMLEEIGRLNELVDGLLTLSRADAGQVALHLADQAPLELLRDAAAMLEVLAQEKGIALTVEGDAAARLRCDRTVLRQAIVNVMHNAIKFTPCGGAITARAEPAGGGVIQLSVSDTGPGIAAADASRVFERFYRGHASAGSGAGLGLAIARWAVEAHGGAIGASSAAGGGCVIWMRLPAGLV